MFRQPFFLIYISFIKANTKICLKIKGAFKMCRAESNNVTYSKEEIKNRFSLQKVIC